MAGSARWLQTDPSYPKGLLSWYVKELNRRRSRLAQANLENSQWNGMHRDSCLSKLILTRRLWCIVQGMNLHWCMQPDVGLPQPDAVIFLSLDAAAAVNRASYGNERYENIAFQKRVADVFKQLKSPYWEVCRFYKVVNSFSNNNNNVPSVFWCHWLGGRKGIRPEKNLLVGCWCGYLFGTKWRFAYCPPDATATHCR